MRTTYIPKLQRLMIDYGNGFYIYDPKEIMHLNRKFSDDDVEKMKGAGIQWLTEMCNYSASNTEQPWFSFAYKIKEHLLIEERKYVFPPLDKMSLQEKEHIWDAYLWFMKTIYVTSRYKQRQELLWEDMRKDYDFWGKFFKEYSSIHVGLLMHYMASVIGFEIGNVAGD